MKAKFISILSSFGAVLLSCFGGTCGIACLAGGCCGGTALLSFLSLSGSTLSFLNKLTPVFLSLTVLSLGYAFYKAYKPKPVACCPDSNNTTIDGCCTKEKKPSFFKSKAFLWVTTALCLIMWCYPLFFNNKTKTPDSSSCCPPSKSSDSIQNPKIIKINPSPCCNQ